MIQQCAMRGCEKWETTETMPRFKRCSKCKRRYYVRPRVRLSVFLIHLTDDLSRRAVLDRSKFAPFAFLSPPNFLTRSFYQHQHEDWPAHKADCKDLVKMRFTDVENRRRAGTYAAPTKPVEDDDGGGAETDAALSQ